MSSSRIAPRFLEQARPHAVDAADRGARRRRARMRSSAQKRLTAVGRVAPSPAMARSRSAARPAPSRAALCRAASATPNAAATPMAGAPRTTRVLMACATSCQRRAGLIDLLGGQPRLVEQHEPLAAPSGSGEIMRGRARAARGDRRGSGRRRGRACRAPRAPRTSSMADARHAEGVREQLDHRAVGAALRRARRSRARASASPRQPSTAFRGRGAGRARGAARPQALGCRVILVAPPELLIEQPLVHLDGGAQPLGELTAQCA